MKKVELDRNRKCGGDCDKKLTTFLFEAADRPKSTWRANFFNDSKLTLGAYSLKERNVLLDIQSDLTH